MHRRLVRDCRPESAQGMQRLIKQNPGILGLIIVVVILAGGSAAILRGKTWRVPDLTAEAEAAYSRRDWERADQLARKRLKQVPDDPRALQVAARTASHQDRDQLAIAIYSRLFVEAVDAEDLYLLGRALNRTGKIDAAFKSYEKARLAAPDHPETLDALAQLYLQNDRANAAEETAERLMRQPGWEARGLLLLGSARADLHDFTGAVQALRRFFQVDPGGTAAGPSSVQPFRMLLARSLLRSSQPVEARQVLQALLAREPTAEASWLLGRCYIQEKDWNRAASMLSSGASYRAEHPLEPEPAPYVGAARLRRPAMTISIRPRSPASTPRHSPVPGTSTSWCCPGIHCRIRGTRRSPTISRGGTARSRSKPALGKKSRGR